MASAWIIRHRLPSGKLRYRVRYRLGGREAPARYGGSFPTRRLADERLAWVQAELAAMRVPGKAIAAPEPVQTLAAHAQAYAASRIDAAAETRKNLGSHLKRILPAFGTRDPASITVDDVQEWVTAISAELAPSSVRRYLATLRLILDRCTDPNPARDRAVRLPRVESTVVEPPSAAQVAAMFERVPRRWRLPLRVLEATAMRVGEVGALTWGDVDLPRSRWRVTGGKTAAARRWVPVPPELLAEVLDTCPPDDRMAERRLFPGFTPDVAKNVMARACRAAGVGHYHPHDLRHRRISVLHREGVSWAAIAAMVGHASPAITARVYTHVLLDDE